MKPTIVFLTNELTHVNGRATTGYELCDYLIKQQFDVRILTYQGARNDPIAEHIFPVLPAQKPQILPYCLKTLFRAPVKRADLVICNLEEFLPLAVLLKFKLRSKAVLIGQGTYIYYPFVRPAKKHFARLLLRQLDLLVVPSRYTHDKVREFFQGRMAVINWGVNPARHFPVKDVAKEPAFVFVGELKARKGIYVLLPAFERLRREFPELKLYLVGGTQRYDGAMAELNLPPNVMLTGEIAETTLLSAYYSKAIAHVLPSVSTPDSFEGFGIVHLEANACGIPTIGAFDSGNEDAIVDGVTGFLCPPQDVDFLYEKMKLLVTDAALRERMGAQAYAYAMQHTWHQAGAQLVAALNPLLGGAGVGCRG